LIMEGCKTKLKSERLAAEHMLINHSSSFFSLFSFPTDFGYPSFFTQIQLTASSAVKKPSYLGWASLLCALSEVIIFASQWLTHTLGIFCW